LNLDSAPAIDYLEAFNVASPDCLNDISAADDEGSVEIQKILELVEKDFASPLEDDFTFSNYPAHSLKKDSIFDNNSMMLPSPP